MAGAALVFSTWTENFGGKVATEVKEAEAEEGKAGRKAGEAAEAAAPPPSPPPVDGGALMQEAVSACLEDKRILFVGAVQAFFEGAMYIFVLQVWRWGYGGVTVGWRCCDDAVTVL